MLAYDVLLAARMLLIGVGTAALVTGVTQIARTLALTHIATNADAVIGRSAVLIGVGAAFWFAALSI